MGNEIFPVQCVVQRAEAALPLGDAAVCRITVLGKTKRKEEILQTQLSRGTFFVRIQG